MFTYVSWHRWRWGVYPNHRAPHATRPLPLLVLERWKFLAPVNMPIPKAATRGSPSQNGVHRVDPEARQAQYEALFEILPHPVWVLDRATLRFLAANLAAVEHFGYTREAL